MMTTVTPTPNDSATVPKWLIPLLKIDGVGSIVIGVALVATAGWLTDPLGAESVLPIVLVGALFVVNGPVNLGAARTPTRERLLGPIGIDTVFGVAMFAVAVADHSGADTWARWAIAAVGLLSFDLAAAKAWGRRRLA